MAHKTGNILCRSMKFASSNAINVMRYPYHPEYLKPLYFGHFVSLNIPAIGSTVTDAALEVNEGPESAGQFVAPYDCRVIGIGYSIYWYNPQDGCTGLRIGIMHCQLTDLEYRLNDATWKTLARMDTSAMTGDPPRQIQKGTATFASSDGDVAGGELIGVVTEALGYSTHLIYGCITVMLEAR